MLRSFRTRLAVTVVLLVGVTAALVAALSYVLVQRSLRSQLVDGAVAQAEFNIGVLASTDVLETDAGPEEFAASGLAARFLQRGSDGLYVEFAEGDPFASRFDLVGAGPLLGPELRRLVTGGRFGYDFLEVADAPNLVVGGRRLPAGPDFYFFFSAAEVEAALAELGRFLIAAGIGVVILGVLVAGLVARGVLRPVRTASAAAGAMAAGNLSVRLPVESADEFGRWAESFNSMAASLEAKVAELQEGQMREQRFVADVSHELRTPLTALVAEAEMLRTHLADMPPAARRVSELLSADVDRLRELVQDLLEISRLDATPAAAEIGDVDVTRFLDAVVAGRLPDAEVHSEVAGSVRCDRRALERIIGNLLDNAGRHAPGAPVAVTAWREDADLVVTVADEGPGVPPAALPHLFDRFYSADAARGRGSGLGLAIARQHARHLGGELEVRPNDPTGLVFEIRLPVVGATAPDHESGMAAASRPAARRAEERSRRPHRDPDPGRAGEGAQRP